MGAAPQVYSPLVWYILDGTRVAYKVFNRADNPEPGGRLENAESRVSAPRSNPCWAPARRPLSVIPGLLLRVCWQGRRSQSSPPPS
jgi:hypothetical protein